MVGLGLSVSHSGGTPGLVYIKVPLFKEFVQLPIKVHCEPHVDHFFVCLFYCLFDHMCVGHEGTAGWERNILLFTKSSSLQLQSAFVQPFVTPHVCRATRKFKLRSTRRTPVYDII